MKRIAAALLLLALGAARAAEAPGPEPVFAHPADSAALATLLGAAVETARHAAGLRGSFTQKKFLRELPQPLVSSGDFLVARGIGVDWHTRQPFDSDVVLTPQALIQRGADGAAQRVDASQQPGLAAVAQIFDALFALDLQALAQRFALSGEKGAGEDWTLGLVPHEAAFAKNVARIVITGAKAPQQVTLFEAGGDRTVIALENIAPLSSLSEAEHKRFAP